MPNLLNVAQVLYKPNWKELMPDKFTTLHRSNITWQLVPYFSNRHIVDNKCVF